MELLEISFQTYWYLLSVGLIFFVTLCETSAHLGTINFIRNKLKELM